jgi:hypothetical protein
MPYNEEGTIDFTGPLPEQGGGGYGGNSLLGGMLAGVMGGAGQAAGNPNTSEAGRHNDMLSSLTQGLAMNPFRNAEDAAGLDLKKVLAQRKGVAGLIDPNTFSKLGSTNPSILGVNQDPADIAETYRGNLEDEGSGLLGKILQGALGIGAKFIPGL